MPSCSSPGTAQLAIRETHFEKRPERLSRLRMELVPEPGEVVPPPAPLERRSWRPSSSSPPCSSPSWAGPRCRCGATPASNMNTFGGQAGSAHVAAQEDEVRSHSNAEMTYHGGRFRLEPGEALVVTVHEPDKPFLYWGLTLTSPWMESFDYRYTTTALEQQDGHALGGRVLAHGHRAVGPGPGVENWLDTGGRLEGYMLVRWVLADGPPHPTAEVVDGGGPRLVRRLRRRHRAVTGVRAASAGPARHLLDEPAVPVGVAEGEERLVVGPAGVRARRSARRLSKWKTSLTSTPPSASWRRAPPRCRAPRAAAPAASRPPARSS